MIDWKWEKDEVCDGSETTGLELINGQLVEITVIGKQYEIVIGNEAVELEEASSNLEAKTLACMMAVQLAFAVCVKQML